MVGSLQIRVVGQEIRAVNFTRSMAPPGACAHLGYQSPTPRYPSAGVGPTKQDRSPSTPAQSEGPLRGPPRRGSPRSTTRRSRPPRHHPPLDTPPTRGVRALRRCTRSIGLNTAARVGRWGRLPHDPVARRRGRCCGRHPPLDQARPTAAGVLIYWSHCPSSVSWRPQCAAPIILVVDNFGNRHKYGVRLQQ